MSAQLIQFIILASAMFASGMALAQDSPPPEARRPRSPDSARLKNSVKVKLQYHYDEENDFHHLRHPGTPFRLQGLGTQEGRNEFSFDADYYFKEPSQAGPSVSFGLSFGAPDILIGGGFSREIKRIIETVIEGDPLEDPPTPTRAPHPTSSSARSSTISGVDADVTDSDRPLLYGPTMYVLVKEDVSEWDTTSWAPSKTSLLVYARALFGSLDVFATEASMSIYSVGPRLVVPILGSPEASLALGATVSGGPAWLKTDIGDATGFELAGGLQSQLAVSRSVSLTAGLELAAFWTEDLFSWGPIPTLGLDVKW